MQCAIRGRLIRSGRGQRQATASVAWRGRSWRPSRGSGKRASRPCSQRGRPGGKPWALEGGLGQGATRRRPGGAGGVRRRRRRGAGRREVGEAVRGSLVNKSKFQNQFCNFKFYPSSWPQMKNVEYHFCSVFRDLQLSCYALFHSSNGLRVI